MKSAAFVAGLLGVLVGLAVGAFVWGGEPPVPQPVEVPGSRNADVVAELRGIRAQLAQQPVRMEVARDGAQAPVMPLDPSVTPGQLDALVASIANLVQSMQATPPGAAPGLRAQVVSPTAGEDLEALITAFRSGEPFDPELFGLSPREVYRKLGPPGSTRVDDNGSVMWYYADRNGDIGSLILTFADGYLVRYYAR